MMAFFFEGDILAEKLKPLLDKTHESLNKIRLQLLEEVGLPPTLAKPLMLELTMLFVLNLMDRVVRVENALIEEVFKKAVKARENRKIGG